jgi:hypothetical protein
MTEADWIALLGVALPLAAKVAVDLAAYFAARKDTALANIVGMAGRQAASAARTLASLPAGTDAKGAEQAMVASARAAIVSEMADSMAVVKGSDAQVTTIVQGELDKLVVAPIAVLPVAPQPLPGSLIQPSPSVPHAA